MSKFPVKNLSPPVVASPVYACSEAVHLTGVVPGATVKVYANTEKLAEVVASWGFPNVILSRRVALGESISATQTVDGLTSDPSIQPVVVSAVPFDIVKQSKPVVTPVPYECGQVVRAEKLLPGLRLSVSEDATEIADEPGAETWNAVFTPPLHAGKLITARQVACRHKDDPIPLQESWTLTSDPVAVQSAPSPVPPPMPRADSMIPGNNMVVLDGLLIGAKVQIFDGSTSISSGWYSNWPSNFFPLTSALTATSKVTATQTLCTTSQPSIPVEPTGKLLAPKLLEPICPKSRFVIVRGTFLNAKVVILRGGDVIAYAGAAQGDLVVGLGGGISLNAGDVITAVQFAGFVVSPTSNPVTVVSKLSQPVVEILGGEPFFLPKAGENAIDGPVFPRGRGGGPFIRVGTCCSQDVSVQIFSPSGDLVAKPQLTEVFPGSFTCTWDWTSSNAGWPLPNGIPVGKYTVVAHSGCDLKDISIPLYVIFNPDDVGGPARFSFDDMAVWFVGTYNEAYPLPFYLHQSDMRVFSIAINAVTGKTDPYESAVAVARAEEALFGYSISVSHTDVLDLLLHSNLAQCADDASMLTSLLRAVGIPAHPVTADAAIETGGASWRFDTWTEFLAPLNGVLDWRVFHPHEFPNMQPESRGTFGTTRGVAEKSTNDIIIMANETWTSFDGSPVVSFKRQPCGEPDQVITKPSWISELCESGYWPVPHWDCSVMRRRTLSAPDGFHINNEGEIALGRPVSGSISIINNLEERTFGTIVIELVSSVAESKSLAEECFGSTCKLVTLNAGKSFKMTFEFKLPHTLAPGRDLILRAHVDDNNLATHTLGFDRGISCKIIEPKDKPAVYLLDEEYKIRATVTNTSNHAKLKDVSVELIVPYALTIEDKKTHLLDVLKPKSSVEVAWKIKAVAALRVGFFKISIVQKNGGLVETDVGLAVERDTAGGAGGDVDVGAGAGSVGVTGGEGAVMDFGNTAGLVVKFPFQVVGPLPLMNIPAGSIL